MTIIRFYDADTDIDRYVIVDDIQVSHDELRDQDGHVIARYDPFAKRWVTDDDRTWTDWTVEQDVPIAPCMR